MSFSYGRRDAAELADRLEQDLSLFGYEVWRDTRKIRSGTDFLREIEDGLRSTQLVVALLSPQAIREASDPDSPDDLASVCLDELRLARFSYKVPTVPVRGRYLPGRLMDSQRSAGRQQPAATMPSSKCE